MSGFNNKEGQQSCWSGKIQPSQKLIEKIKKGAYASSDAKNKVDELTKFIRRDDVKKPTIFIGAGTCGLGAGAGKTIEAIKNHLAKNHVDAEIVHVGCIGLCSEEPVMDVQLPGRTRVSYGRVTEEAVDGLLSQALKGNVSSANLLGQFRGEGTKPWDGVAYLDEHPFFVRQRRLVLGSCGIIDPLNIDEYIAGGGYSALLRSLTELSADKVCNIIEESGLRGRGGGGFPTGKKWKLARKEESSVKYLICNADEGDPGAFMDRAVAESDPHRLLEGILIAAYAIGATKSYIYIRAEYPLAIKNLERAIEDAKQYGFLGKNILGTDFSLDIVIKKGAGAFVCGEETALIQSVEGKRGMPRPRPPYPAISGLFGKPTIINNVETLANVSAIITRGPEFFVAMGTNTSKGTKVFALSGMVERTGLVEIPMKTPLREIVFQIGGGIPNGKKCKAIQIGGPSGGCIPEAHLDIPTDYEELKAFGAIMGSGGLVVLDESTCMVDLAKYFMEFIQNESCGKCIPCREGTKRMLEILKLLTGAKKNERENDSLLRIKGIMGLRHLASIIKDTSLCGLGQTAPNPVLSTLKWFRDEYEAHLFERRCPAGACKELVGAPCMNACPVGTEVWKYVAHISRKEYNEAYKVIRDANPLPAVCARVCNHPCENNCRCGATGGEAISIRALKRFIVDTVKPEIYRHDFKAANDKSHKVAVVGAGPAGLTAAHYLSLKGHKVTLFERERAAGGMLVAAIPEYRLPRNVLRAEINNLLNDNISLVTGKEFGKDLSIDGLFADGYNAIYLAMGAHKSNKLGIDGENSKSVYQALDFLKAYNLEAKELAHGKVGVIGGGNSAIDAARVAIRQKLVSSVTIFYRRTRNEMPAYAEEIEQALEENITLIPLISPVQVLSEGGNIKSVKFIHNRLGDRDTSGRQSPVPVPGSEEVFDLDTLIVATGEKPDTAGLQAILSIGKQANLTVNPVSCATNTKGVFGGGDFVRGPNTVIDAIADGKRAASMIDNYLTGRQLKEINKVVLPSVYLEPPESMTDDENILRLKQEFMPAGERKKCHAEVELSIKEKSALTEACRCLRCDLEFTHTE